MLTEARIKLYIATETNSTVSYELNSSSKSHKSKVSASDSQLTPTEGFVVVDVEGVYELEEILQTIVTLHQVSSSCRVLNCIVPTTLSLIAWSTEARTRTKFRGSIHTHASFVSRPNALLFVPYLQSSCSSEL